MTTDNIILLLALLAPLMLIINILTIFWFFDFKQRQVIEIIKLALLEAYIENTTR